MSESQYTNIIHVSPVNEANELAAEIRLVCSPPDQCSEANTAGIGGTEVAEIILALGSSGAVLAIARVIIAWINAKKSRVVKLNGNELQGYSATEVERILTSK